MTTESKNKRLARRLLEEVANTGGVDRLPELLAPEYVARDAGIQGLRAPESISSNSVAATLTW